RRRRLESARWNDDHRRGAAGDGGGSRVMPVYTYKAFAANGKQISGVEDADNLRALRTKLRRDGIYLTSASEANLRAREAASVAGDIAGGGRRGGAMLTPAGRVAFSFARQRESADRRQVAILTRQLAVLLKAGVPLAESLGALVDQAERPGLKRV